MAGERKAVRRNAPANNAQTEEQRKKAAQENAMQKLVSLNMAMVDLGIEPENLFKTADRNRDKKLTITEFQQAILQTKISISPIETQYLFEYIDVNKDEFVTMDEFVEALKAETKKVEDKRASQPTANSNTKGTAPAKDMPISAPQKQEQAKESLKQSYQKAGVTEEEVERNFDVYMSKIKLDKSDYFMNVKTILNDPMKALKKCVDIVNELKAKKSGKMLFEDPDFGPSQKDPFGFNSISFDPPYRGAPNPQDVAWCRPKEISPDVEPEFLVDGATSNDVNQGALGDCWLIGAMSILSSNDAYIRGNFKPDLSKPNEVSKEEQKGMMMGVYPPIFHSFRKYGIYVFRFFKNSQWRFVIIDDKLPCYKGGGTPDLIFASCSVINEFWVPLLEKAYAKMHKTFQALFSGDLSDGLVDFTGLVSEKVIIQDKGKFNAKQLKSKDELWKKMVKLKASGTLMGSSIVGTGIEHTVMRDGEDTGLVSGHAYSVQGVIEIMDTSGQKQRLVRVRNPWGSKNAKEWTGAWCDASEEMVLNYEAINQVILAMDKEEAELIDMKNMKDGMFFMSFDDFTDVFCKLSICHKFPEEYDGVRFNSRWEGNTAGGTPYKGTPEQVKNWANNVQYLLKVTQKTHVFVSLGQEDGRLNASSEEVFPFAASIHPAVIVALKTKDEIPSAFDGRAILGMSPIKQFKEVSLELNLEPGSYVIVPSTQDMGQTGNYFLSIYHNGGKSAVVKNLSTGKAAEVIPEEDENYTVEVDKEVAMYLKFKGSETIFK
jgi:calpain, invertebrate